MKHICSLLFLVLIFVNAFAQNQDISLAEKNIKKLFEQSGKDKIAWEAYYKSDSAYYKTDTVVLYKDSHGYFYLKASCYSIEWTFNNSKTFTITQTYFCQEPPVSTIASADCDLKIRFSSKKEKLTMILYKDGIIRDAFDLISLQRIKVNHREPMYILTMVRNKMYAKI